MGAIPSKQHHLIPTKDLVLYEERYQTRSKRALIQSALEAAVGRWLSGETQPTAPMCAVCHYPVMRIFRIEREHELESEVCQCGWRTVQIRKRT